MRCSEANIVIKAPNQVLAASRLHFLVAVVVAAPTANPQHHMEVLEV